VKISCDIIADLLPLYYDDVCSESSRNLVDEHLRECEKCRCVLGKIGENSIDNHLQKEREDVIGHHMRLLRRKFLFTGIRTASIIAIPVLIQMIVNITTDYSFDYFFIILTALITLVSVKIVPLIFERDNEPLKLKRFIASFTLLLLTLTIFRGGSLSFTVMIPIAFGMLIIFLPYIMKSKWWPKFELRNQGLLTMLMDILFLYALFAASRLYGIQFNWWLGSFFALVCMLLPWGLFSAVRYIKANAYVRTGMYIIFGGMFLSLIEMITFWFTRNILRLPFQNADLSVWNNDSVVSANIFLLTIVACSIIGGALIVIGLMQKKSRGEV